MAKHVSAAGLDASVCIRDLIDCGITTTPGDGVGVVASVVLEELGTTLIYSYVDGSHGEPSMSFNVDCANLENLTYSMTVGNEAPKAVAMESVYTADEMSVVNNSDCL